MINCRTNFVTVAKLEIIDVLRIVGFSFRMLEIFVCGAIAQLVERLHGMDKPILFKNILSIQFNNLKNTSIRKSASKLIKNKLVQQSFAQNQEQYNENPR